MGRVRAGRGENGKGENGKGESGKGENGKGENGKGESGKSESGKGESGKGESGKSESGKGESGKGESGKGKQGSGGDQRGGAARPKLPAESKSSGGRNAAPPRPRAPSVAPPSPPSAGIDWLLSLVKWLVYGAVIVVVAVGLWRSRHQLPEILRRFLEAWRGFWDWLFGRRRKGRPAAAVEGQTAAAAPRRFADYADPFAAGAAGRYRPDELVRYSFEALEAWARDNGLAREPDQTPHEFSQRIGVRVASLAGDVRTLAELYYRAAYARGSLSPTAVRPLASLWEHLRAATLPRQDRDLG